MKIKNILLFALLACCKQLFAEDFEIVNRSKKVSICYDTECKLDSIAASLLAADIERISGYRPIISKDIKRATGNIIVIGSVNSKLIKGFGPKLALDDVKGKWEVYGYRILKSPTKKIEKALFISGSDFRGTAYGVFDLSNRLGVSSWYWWADIKPAKKESIHINIENYTSTPPAVKFRGIFINDEDWGLQPWAAKTFEPETGDIGPKTYAKVFELLLRLKANIIWPAMHPSTKAFFHYPGNLTTAGDCQIVIGSSHAEPMLRNNVAEWDKKSMGSFNYITNKNNVYNYWEDRIKASRGINAMYTVGMRGVHDSGMEGVKSPKEAVPLIEQIFQDQRGLLSKYINKDVNAVPQVFTAYKEVLDIYDAGLKVPENVTLVWPDDNYGYIHRLNNEAEQKRSGGAGVYYHASYWGRPHDYLWLSSTHPSLIREEMLKAYETGANHLWVLNVGDIKPLEYNISMFMDMALNPAPFKDSKYPRQHLLNWNAEIFGREHASKIQDLLWKYYQLAFERRPEFMGWSRTEPETKTTYTEYNHFYFGDEAQRRIDSYDTLEAEVRKLRPHINAKDADAFYQLVYYPIVGASQLNKKFLFRDKSYFYSKQNRLSAFEYARMSKNAYDSIAKETDFYNHRLSNGKWNHIMSMAPRELAVFQEPVLAAITIDSTGIWGIAPEGFVTRDSSLLGLKTGMSMPAFDPLNRQKYFVDIFLSKNEDLDWSASASADWIRLSKHKGLLSGLHGKQQERIWVDIDWSKITNNGKSSGSIVFTGAGKRFVLSVLANNLNVAELADFKGFVENNGFVSIQATNFNRQIKKANREWKRVKGLGYSGNVLQVLPLNIATKPVDELNSIQLSNSGVEYDFYTYSSASPSVTVFTLPTHPLNNNFGVRYAISIDEDPLKLVDFKTPGRNEDWKQNVLRNRSERRIQMSPLTAGKHTLKIYSVDPGVAIDEILIDLGGLKKAYSSVSETKVKH